jgi:hypothetical protein
MATDEIFVKDYIAAWSVEDGETHKGLIGKLYANGAVFYAHEPNDDPVECRGVTDITANITQVNERLVQGQGLITESTGFSINHDTIKLTWKMNTAEGKCALTGMNILRTVSLELHNLNGGSSKQK